MTDRADQPSPALIKLRARGLKLHTKSPSYPLDLDVPAGELTALVGPTVNPVLRALAGTKRLASGCLRIASVTLSPATTARWRQLVTLVQVPPGSEEGQSANAAAGQWRTQRSRMLIAESRWRDLSSYDRTSINAVLDAAAGSPDLLVISYVSKPPSCTHALPQFLRDLVDSEGRSIVVDGNHGADAWAHHVVRIS